MRIGILQCDDVMDELQPEFGNYPAMFEALLGEIAPDWEYVTYRVIDGEFPDSVDACDGYISTGSRYSVNDGYPWIGQLETFVSALAQAGKKYVGICFGHQLLANVMKGRAELSDRGWGVGMSFNQIDIKKFCPYYMLQYGDHMMSVQGHPEFSQPYSSALMARRADRIPAPRGREGQASLAAKVDDRLMMRWIINFFAKDGALG